MNGKSVKYAMKRPIVKWSGWTGWKCGTRSPRSSYVRFLEFSSGSFGALCKILYVKIFKRLLLQQFSSKFIQTLQKATSRGKYSLLLFLAIWQILKVYGTFEEKLPGLALDYQNTCQTALKWYRSVHCVLYIQVIIMKIYCELLDYRH